MVKGKLVGEQRDPKAGSQGRADCTSMGWGYRRGWPEGAVLVQLEPDTPPARGLTTEHTSYHQPRVPAAPWKPWTQEDWR